MNLITAAGVPGVDLVGAAVVVSAIVSLIKPFLETVLAPTARLHDPVLRLLAVSLGIVVVVLAAGAGGGFHTSADILNAVLAGLGIGAGAVGVFHVVTMFPTPQPVTALLPSLAPSVVPAAADDGATKTP